MIVGTSIDIQRTIEDGTYMEQVLQSAHSKYHKNKSLSIYKSLFFDCDCQKLYDNIDFSHQNDWYDSTKPEKHYWEYKWNEIINKKWKLGRWNIGTRDNMYGD